MNKRRNCVDIIDQIIEKIPSENEELLKSLVWNRTSASYKPLEEIIQWDDLYNILICYIGIYPSEEWQFEVWSIFTTKNIDELKHAIHNK